MQGYRARRRSYKANEFNVPDTISNVDAKPRRDYVVELKGDTVGSFQRGVPVWKEPLWIAAQASVAAGVETGAASVVFGSVSAKSPAWKNPVAVKRFE